MTLTKPLLQYVDDQIAAGMSTDQLQALIREVLTRWEVDPVELTQYLFEQMKEDVLGREQLRFAVFQSVTDDPTLTMPADMDARIRQRLFGTTDKQPQASDPVPPSRVPRHTGSFVFRSTAHSVAAYHGGDQPNFENFAVDPDWETVGPVLSRLVWFAREHELAWKNSTSGPQKAEARRRAIQWRAVARVGHLDATALTELEDYRADLPLESNVQLELEDLAQRFEKMSDGIRNLLETSRVKEPHA